MSNLIHPINKKVISISENFKLKIISEISYKL